MRTMFLILMGCFPFFIQAQAPQVIVVTEGHPTSLRGLSVVSDKVVWASGSNGTVARSLDGGNTWKWLRVKGFEQRDFRDIEAFDGTTALIMAIDAPAYILKTVDGGDNWKVVFENKTPGMFLDAMEFWNDQSGIVVGDPIDGKIFIARSFDGGNSWKALPGAYTPAVDSGEAFFAASGTNVRALDRDEAVMVSGGSRSRIFIRNQQAVLPLAQGRPSAGANSVAVLERNTRKGGNKLVVVGGDFEHPAVADSNCCISTNRGKTWKAPQQGPKGYRSGVEYLGKKKLAACGPTGVDVSADGGNTWINISTTGFHTVRKAKEGKTVWLSGGNGRVGKLLVP